MKRYDLHIHSNYSSCSDLTPAEILRVAKKKGLDGIAVTDHNTIKGGLVVSKLNNDENFEVVVGSEVMTTDGGEVVGYYLSKEVKPGKFLDVVKQIKEQGGIVSLAHPFDFLRMHFGSKTKDLKNLGIDSLEINGRCLLPFFNGKSRSVAQKLGLGLVGGSDAHFGFEIGRMVTCFEGDLRKAIVSRKSFVQGNTGIAPLGYFRTAIYARKILPDLVLRQFRKRL